MSEGSQQGPGGGGGQGGGQGGGGDPARRRRRRRRKPPGSREGDAPQGQKTEEQARQGGQAPQGPRQPGTQQPRHSRPPRSARPERPPVDGSSATPWTAEREAEERRREEVRAERVEREQSREVDPREVCTDRPVFLVAQKDAQDEFLDDLCEPEWDIGMNWVRTVTVLSPFMRVRQESDAADLFLMPGDEVIMSTPRGIELGIVLDQPRWHPATEEVTNKILRCAGYSDNRQVTRNDGKSLEAFEMCARLVSERRLDMKLMRVEYVHGGGKAVFYFTAEKRVDFRQLIRDLAAQLHIRIEMRQIGVRDAARLVGGVGPCGQQVCCNRFLTDFAPVSIKMAKVQNLQLNPQKVSGVCGRLLCCLEYEYTQYCEMMNEAPRMGREVQTPHGPARIRELQLMDRRCVCELADGTKKACSWDEITYERDARGQQQQTQGRDRRRGQRSSPAEEKGDDRPQEAGDDE